MPKGSVLWGGGGDIFCNKWKIAADSFRHQLLGETKNALQQLSAQKLGNNVT